MNGETPSVPPRSLRRVAVGLALALVTFHMFAAGVAPFTALVQRPVHLLGIVLLGMLGFGVRAETLRGPPWLSRGATVLLGLSAIASFGYLLVQQEALIRRAGSATMLDVLAGALAILVVLEVARRSTGWGLVVVCLMALAYAMLGPWLPGPLAHRGYGLSRIVQHVYLSTEGIWGVPLGVSADFVFLFVLFGTILEFAGGGELLIALAARVAGKSAGGPAKTAAVASAIMGSLSGSAVANVVTTGSLTIPMMKRTGFKPHFAGAIEAAASTGGQVMPPIMGAGAFILATWTSIPYVRVATAAVLPALLYYVALLAAVHFRAKKRRLDTVAIPLGGNVSGRLHLLVSLLAIVILLALGRSPMRAAFWGVSAALVLSAMRSTTRLTWSRLADAFLAAASGTVQVASACAAAGIVVGVASLTGIGLRMSELIVTLSVGVLPIALFLTACGSIVLGMGLPTTAAYVVLAALGAPALTELGVPLLAAHLFIFYFGCISNVTPPVALAAFAGAGLAGAPPMLTAMTAFALAGGGVLVPFLFVYEPSLLLNGDVVTVLWAFVRSAIALIVFASVWVGFWQKPLTLVPRVTVLIGGICMIVSSPIANVIGIAILFSAWIMMNRAPESLSS